MSRVFVVGAGGLGRCVAQYIEDGRGNGERARFAGFLDDGGGQGVVGPPDQPRNGNREYRVVAVASPVIRRQLSRRVSQAGGQFYTVVHPTSYVAPTALVGQGSVVGPLAFIGPDARIGDHCYINAQAFVDHDVVVGSYTYVGPQAVVAGHARLGEAVRVDPHAFVEARRVVGAGRRIRARAGRGVSEK